MTVQTSSGGSSKKRSPAPVKSARPTKRLAGAKAVNKSYGPGPVTVYVKSPSLTGATGAAIRRTNTQVGQKVFKQVNAPRKADVVVRSAKAKRAMNTGSPGYGGTKGQVKVGAQKALSDQSLNKKAVVARTIQHELGHAIGLAHPGPAKNPYLQPVGSKKSRKSGIMGSGKRLNTNEVAEIKALRAHRKRMAKIALKKMR